jgi:glutamyl-tRNA reductase
MDISRFHLCAHRIVSLSSSELDAVEHRVRTAHADAAIVKSCQRLEAYGAALCACTDGIQLHGLEAVLHLAEVAAGLDSVVLGEAQIIGQARTALAAVPAELRALTDTAIAAARELRRVTRFDSHAGHLLDRSLKVADVPPSGRLLVLGAGAMGRLVAGRGMDLGFDEVIVAGRTKPTLRQGQGWTFAPLGTAANLPAVDVVAGCLGSGAGEIGFERMPAIRRLAIDLGTPRNFGDSARVPLITIAGLLADEESRPHAMRRRRELREQLRAVLERRLAAVEEDGKSIVGAVRARVEQVRQRELARMRRLHPEIAPETLDTLSRSLVNQLFHAPSQKLKELDDARLGREFLSLFEPG